VLFPFLLGAASAAVISRIKSRRRLPDVIILSNMYVIIVFSFAFNFMLLGEWFIAMAASVLVSILVARGDHRTSPAFAASKHSMPSAVST